MFFSSVGLYIRSLEGNADTILTSSFKLVLKCSTSKMSPNSLPSNKEAKQHGRRSSIHEQLDFIKQAKQNSIEEDHQFMSS
jgi:hypothetical protein